LKTNNLNLGRVQEGKRKEDAMKTKISEHKSQTRKRLQGVEEF
jgi:hypothetical protein